MTNPTILQWILATVTLMFALLVVLGRNPVISAISLMATLFSTALLFFSIQAYFIGVVQILIYAGAISVLFIFIVMLLDLKPTRVRIPGRAPIYMLSIGVGAVFLIAALMGVLPVLSHLGILSLTDISADSSLEAQSIAQQLLSKYMIPFQVSALLLLAALMGVVVLGKKNMVGEKEEGKRDL
jgi:NADH-quinone oxidoreductase subunit J